MGIFDFSNYREFLKSYISKLPRRGHGELSKIAQHLGVHSTLVSLILSGERDLSAEQAYDLAQYLHLTDLETDYFNLLVQLSRGGNHRYKSFVKKKMEETKAEALKLSHRFTHDKSLSDEERSIFYSSWVYSAIRLYTSTEESGRTLEEIVERFDLPRVKVLPILQFLTSAGLLKLEADRYSMGVQRTFLEQGSPHLLKHHSNWRIKALQKSDQISEKEMMFTSPISVSRKDFDKIRESLAHILKEVSQTVKDSPAEDIACLNIDFFWIE
jgi:uncharacterized protein (TIGR02147 family)